MSSVAGSTGPSPRVGDAFATAFARYGGGFATFGLLALVCWLAPVAAYLGCDAAGIEDAVQTAVIGIAFWTALLFLSGGVTALIGGRFRSALGRIVATAVLAGLIPTVLVVLLPPGLVLVALPFILSPLALPVVAAGAGDAWGWRALVLGTRLVAGEFMRSAAVASGVVLIFAALDFGITLALAPLPPDIAQVSAVAVAWAIAGPIGGLVFRAWYGILTGRVVVQAKPPAEPEAPAEPAAEEPA